MPKLFSLNILAVIICLRVTGQNQYSDSEARGVWAQLQKQPLTETSFRLTCDLIQDIAQTNIDISYDIFAQYVPIVRSSGNKRMLHILLMSWAKAKESLTSFDEADSLYKFARENATDNNIEYNEAIVGTILLYTEWGRTDSLNKYLSIGEKLCRKHKNWENLSFVYTFKALSDMSDTANMRRYLDSAALLAERLPNKNALFTALYNRAVFYSQFNLQQQAAEFNELLELSKDSSLIRKPRLYERTAFSFRHPVPSIYYQLILLDLLLTDYDNAWKFAELIYATIKDNPSNPQGPVLNAIMSMVQAYRGDFNNAKQYLEKSKMLNKLPEEKITYPTYLLAAGMIAENAGQPVQALHYYQAAYKTGNMSYGIHLMPPEIYYAHGLLINRQIDSAQKLFLELEPVLKTRTYSSIGFYYYKYYSELLKAKGDFPAYNKAIEIFYTIKDSLANLLHYRALQEVETRMRVRDKEQQIGKLNEENIAKLRALRQQRINLVIFVSLALIIISLLLAYGQNQRHRKIQSQQIVVQNKMLQEIKLEEMEKKHRIRAMQGAIDAEETERHKIADQLHDDTGSMLALASLNISSALEKGKDDPQFQDKVQKAYEIVLSVSSTIRDISHRLTPLFIEKYGFRKAIDDLEETINLSEKINLQKIMVGFEDEEKYSLSILNNLYRILQELVHNIVKHARASHALLEIIEHENHISILVEDDGIGIEAYSSTKGKGLQSIQSKIDYLKGKIEISKKKDSGTLIVIEIPV